MTPLLTGVFASQISGHLFSGPTGAYDAIAAVTVPSAGLSEITFSGIPDGYSHLQIRAIHRQNLANTGVDWLNIRFNGDTASNYAYHYLLSDGGSGSSGNGVSQNRIFCSLGNPSNNQTANMYGASIIDILDYKNSYKNKTARIFNGLANNSTSEDYVMLSSGLWMNTAPITSITISNNTGTNAFMVNTQFALYGVK